MEILSRDEEENFRIWILATAVNYKTDMSKILTRNHNPLCTHTYTQTQTHTHVKNNKQVTTRAIAEKVGTRQE